MESSVDNLKSKIWQLEDQQQEHRRQYQKQQEQEAEISAVVNNKLSQVVERAESQKDGVAAEMTWQLQQDMHRNQRRTRMHMEEQYNDEHAQIQKQLDQAQDDLQAEQKRLEEETE